MICAFANHFIIMIVTGQTILYPPGTSCRCIARRMAIWPFRDVFDIALQITSQKNWLQQAIQISPDVLLFLNACTQKTRTQIPCIFQRGKSGCVFGAVNHSTCGGGSTPGK